MQASTGLPCDFQRDAGIPEDVRIVRLLGKGSNNKVFRISRGDGTYVLRVPRRRSDTQQRGSAFWECRYTLRAAELGVGPLVYETWFSRHARDEWPSGLYMIMESFPHDLETVLVDEPSLRVKLLQHKSDVSEQIASALSKLANDLLFVYDLKPNNVVLSLGEPTKVRIIDFGKDFCEWGGLTTEPDSNTPVISMLRRRVVRREPTWDASQVDALVSHILFAAMLMELAATTTRRLYDDRRDHRMSADERRDSNPFAPLALQLLESMQTQNIALLREVLRMDDVKSVFRHYHGRRNAGSRRTLAYAIGKERA